MRLQAFCSTCILVFAVTSAGSASPYERLHWRSIGPAVPGGRIAAAAGSDRDPFLYYIGGAGGVFKTTNGGTSWTAVFTDKPVAAIGAIAIAASNDDIVWVGTGEGNPRADNSYGKGVWVSNDGAKSWVHRGLDATYAISKLLVDARDPKTALVAALGNPFAPNTERGVFRTTDGGRTWRKTLYVSPTTGASDLAWDPAHPQQVFVGMWQFGRKPWKLTSGGPGSGLYRSRDSGKTWQRLQGHGLPTGIMGRVGVAVAPGHPQRVYAIIESKEGYVWRSDNGGDTWHKTRAGASVMERPFYFTHLWVDPTNANHVYATSVDLSQSYDAGETFKALDSQQNVDNHVMWFSKNGNRILVGHDAGWELSVDHGKTFDWRTNIAISHTYHIGYDLQNPYRVCAGFQDAESWCGPSNSLNPVGILNRDWFSYNQSDGAWIWPDPIDPQNVWDDTYWGSLGFFDGKSIQQADVSPYQHDFDAIGTVGSPYRFGWEAPISFSPQDGHVMYWGGNVLFATSDHGQHWKTISPDLTLNDPAHQQVSGGPITIEGAGVEFYDLIFDIGPSTVEPGLIWIGTDDGLVQLTRDGGATWHNVSVKGIGPYGRVSTVEPSRVSGARAYAVIDRHMLGDRTPYIFRTDDYGGSWTRITHGLPHDDYAHVVREDPKNPHVLYAGLEQGVWVSFDDGVNWQRLQTDLPTTSVRDMRVHPVANDLIIGTHGNSLFILDDLTPLQQLDTAKAAGTYLYQPLATYAFSLWIPEQPGNGFSPPTGAFAGENPKYGAIISYYLGKKAASRPLLEVLDSNGHLVRHLHEDDGVTSSAGIGRAAWNLTEEPPTPWHGAAKWNKGPEDGADVVPQRYTVRLRANGRTLTRDFDVLPDPRASWTQEQYLERHTFLASMFALFSKVDMALNQLDNVRQQVAARRTQLNTARLSSSQRLALNSRLVQAQRRADQIASRLSSNPQGVQDSDFLPDQLRERISYVIGALNYPLAAGTGSYGPAYQGPPSPAQYKEAAEVKAIYDKRMGDYARFVTQDLETLNASLRAARLTPLKVQAPHI